MRRDQKLAKKKKARENARTAARTNGGVGSRSSLRAIALTAPFGPAFIGREWRSEELPPRLVSVVITRRLPNGLYLPHVMLVDRTCLGVKDAFLGEPLGKYELQSFVERIGLAQGLGIEETDLVTAQSVVFAAVDYAARLGFQPHRDFDAAFVGPRPPELEATPLASRPRPFYCPGPYDDMRIVRTLERAVGQYGFDSDFLFDEDDEDEDDEDFDPSLLAELEQAIAADEARAPDEKALLDAIGGWMEVVMREPRIDLDGSHRLYAHAVLGEPAPSETLPAEHRTSLPGFWGSLFRPLADGHGAQTGIELALAHPAMKRHAGVLSRLAQTKARLFEVLTLDAAHLRATCRDVIDGSILVVRFDGVVASKLTRWMRFFGYLTPMSDGTFYAPSALLGHAHLRNVDPSELAQRLNALLSELKLAGTVEPANLIEGLTRFGGIAHGLLRRLAVPTREELEEASRPIYVVNSDGERFEFHEAEIHPTADVSRTLLQALARADDFVEGRNGTTFNWMKEPQWRSVLSNEYHGSIERDEDGSFRVIANSNARYVRLLARLSALAGSPLTTEELKVMRPWEHNAKVIAEETPESRRVICASASVEAPAGDPREAVVEAVMSEARRSLDEHVELLGGRPRDLVADADGRTKVERWLLDREIHGLPSSVGMQFLDLDVLRRDLGLPGVAETLAK